jgi:predicted PurR-regulated permease PerM
MRLRSSDVFFSIALAALLAIAWYLRHVLLLIYVAALLAIVLTPVIDRLRRLRLGRVPLRRSNALAIILAAFLLIAVLGARLALPLLISEIRSLAANWPRYLSELVFALQRLPGHERFASDLQSYLSNLPAAVLQFMLIIGHSLGAMLLVLLMTGYFIVQGNVLVESLAALLGAGQSARLLATLRVVEERVSHWVVGQLLLMLIIACVDAVVYGLLGIHYFLALAAFAGLMNFIPIIGPLIGLVPAVLVAASQSPGKMIAVLAFYAIYQQIDNSFITPRVMRATVKISSLAVVVALVLGTAWAGVAGAFVALPTAAFIEVFLQEYLRGRRTDKNALGYLDAPRLPSAS